MRLIKAAACKLKAPSTPTRVIVVPRTDGSDVCSKKTGNPIVLIRGTVKQHSFSVHHN